MYANHVIAYNNGMIKKKKQTMKDPFVLLVGGRSVEHDDSLNSYFAIREEILSSIEHKRRLSVIYYISRKGSVRLHDGQILPNSEDSLASGGISLSWTEMISKLIESSNYVFSLLHGCGMGPVCHYW